MEADMGGRSQRLRLPWRSPITGLSAPMTARIRPNLLIGSHHCAQTSFGRAHIERCGGAASRGGAAPVAVAAASPEAASNNNAAGNQSPGNAVGGADGGAGRSSAPGVLSTAIDTVLKSLVCGSLGLFTHLVMDGFNNTTYIDKKRFAELLESRKPGQGVVTVCNHVSAVDDPGAVATLVPMSWLVQPRKLRWTLCAKDRCFRDPVSGSILSKGKVLPVERGRGIYQPLMDDVIDKLNDGDWVHMFPEGTRTRDGTLGKPRLGVARLIAEPRITPLVVPFYHSGMETILRRGEWIPVNVGQRLCVLVGEPIDYSDLLARRDAGELTGKELLIAIANRTGSALEELKARMEVLHAKHPELAPPADSWEVAAASEAKRRAKLAAKRAKKEAKEAAQKQKEADKKSGSS